MVASPSDREDQPTRRRDDRRNQDRLPGMPCERRSRRRRIQRIVNAAMGADQKGMGQIRTVRSSYLQERESRRSDTGREKSVVVWPKIMTSGIISIIMVRAGTSVSPPAGSTRHNVSSGRTSCLTIKIPHPHEPRSGDPPRTRSLSPIVSGRRSPNFPAMVAGSGRHRR